MEAQLPSKLPFSKKPLRARIVISYILDYVILIVLVLGFFILDRVEPFHQPFSLENYSLYYPHAVNERVPMPMAMGLSCGVPIGVILVYTILIDGLFSHHSPKNPSSGRRQLMGPYRLKDRLWELNCGILGLFLSQAAAFVITAALKNACGKPRPDIIDRCQLPSSTPLANYELATYDLCTQTDLHILKDGFKSFPSGHSSSSFAGLFYLSLYLAGKLHVLDSRGEVWKSFITLVPTLGAGLIATTRIMDARHHPFDVIFGSLIGIFCAWGSYRQYFPPLTEPWRKGRAYPIRTWGTISQPPAEADRMRLVQPEDQDHAAAAAAAAADDTEYRGVSGPSSQRPPFMQRTRSGSTGTHNPFETEEQPNPFLQRIGTDVPSNYSSSSSDLNRMDSVSLHGGRNNNNGNNLYEMQSQYGSRRRPQQQHQQQPRTVDEEEEATDLAERRPFTGYSAHRPPPPARETSPDVSPVSGPVLERG